MAELINRVFAAMRFLRDHLCDPDSKTYYPNEERKSRWQIILDNFIWMLKHREINHFYYLYGFDRKNFESPKDYFPEQAFIRLRDKSNAFTRIGKYPIHYTCLLHDKFIFSQYLTAMGFPTPEVLALCDSESILWMQSRKREDWGQLSEHEGMDAFLKDSVGRCGEAVFPLAVREGRIYLDDQEIDPETLRKRIRGKYIIQQRIIQHSRMSLIYPKSINTIRLITLRRGNEIILASGTFRMGASGNRFDNWAGGGIGVGIDLKTGKLQEEGTFRLGFGGRVKEHPETGVRFSTYEIPFYQEAALLVQQLHSFFYGVYSIGWDIAVTESGPTLIEGNNSWDIAFQQFHDDQIKRKFVESLPEGFHY